MGLLTSLKKQIESGLKLPHAYDPVTKQQSFRLLSAYLGLIAVLASLIALHIWPGLLAATWTTISFWALAMIFYMLKKLTSAKIDLDDRELSLNSTDVQEKGQKSQKVVDNPD